MILVTDFKFNVLFNCEEQADIFVMQKNDESGLCTWLLVFAADLSVSGRRLTLSNVHLQYYIIYCKLLILVT